MLATPRSISNGAACAITDTGQQPIVESDSRTSRSSPNSASRLVAHKSSEQEIGNLLGIVARDVKDSEAKGVSDDWRFAIAYNAALQAATAALAAAGYRASRESRHYRVIHSLELTVRKDAKFIRVFEASFIADLHFGF
jgi:hypothetical protein